MEEKAQVNLEFLLIIAGGVVVVTAVALFIKSAAGTVGSSAQETPTP
ncbi:MAG: hypothetical protein NTY48_03815 [Candidatus Diapherotrites archaeon]|nr:hypothetical protein [Candidatus Diapherotrites archaeon]